MNHVRYLYISAQFYHLFHKYLNIYIVGEKFQTKVEKRKFAQQLGELVKSMTDVVNPDESNS